jgi:hypothetical protein
MATGEPSTIVETHLHVAQRARKSSETQQNPALRGVSPVSLSDHTAPDAGSAATTTATGPYLALAAEDDDLTPPELAGKLSGQRGSRSWNPRTRRPRRPCAGCADGRCGANAAPFSRNDAVPRARP